MIFQILFLSFLLFYIIINIPFFSKESFKSKLYNNHKIVLIGDSILKNDAYAENSVQTILYQKTEGNTFNYAVDGATIATSYSQISQVPEDLNNSNTFIFVSIGGNNILRTKNIDDSKLDTIFREYQKFIKTLKSQVYEAKIVLLNLYYPLDPQYKDLVPYIEKWNTKINSLKTSMNVDVIELNRIFISADDFKDDGLNGKIEPSEKGGAKLANKILFYYNN